MTHKAPTTPSVPLLQVKDLAVTFSFDGRQVPVVRGVTFSIHRGEMVGLVGESGCGKSVTALALLRLIPDPPGRITAGQVLLDGEDILTLNPGELRAVRGGRVSMVFQDPFSSLNPTMTLGQQIMEAVTLHTPLRGRQARERTLELLRSVHIPAPELLMRRYPHEVSGGQRQRVLIAMAFAANPDLILADEPTTALDVTVQAQVLALMAELRRNTGAAFLLITHDLSVVAETCDRLLVMYAGQIVEEGRVEDVFASPLHPYTEALLRSLPTLEGPRQRRLPAIPGQPPSPQDIGHSCPFADRCPRAEPRCRTAEPPVVTKEPGRWVRCWLHESSL